MKNNPERGSSKLKNFDRYLGIFIIFLLSLFKRNQKICQELSGKEKIAFLKTAAIGDTVLLSAVINDLRNNFPEINITFITGYDNFEISKKIPGINHLIRIPATSPFQAIRIIRKAGFFDLFIDSGSWPRIDAVYSFFSKSACRAGFKTSGQYRHFLYDIQVDHVSEIHELYNYRNLLKPFHINCKSLPVLAADMTDIEKNSVVIHMYPGGSRSYLKEWSDHNWVQLIDSMNEFTDKIYLSGSAKDRNRALELFNRIGNQEKVIVTAGDYSLKETLDLINSAGLVISVDTGVLHIASALKKNLIGLHGPTSSLRWGALNKNSISLSAGLSCSPCISLGFDSDCMDNKCMQGITVENVLDAVKKMI